MQSVSQIPYEDVQCGKEEESQPTVLIQDIWVQRRMLKGHRSVRKTELGESYSQLLQVRAERVLFKGGF